MHSLQRKRAEEGNAARSLSAAHGTPDGRIFLDVRVLLTWCAPHLSCGSRSPGLQPAQWPTTGSDVVRGRIDQRGPHAGAQRESAADFAVAEPSLWLCNRLPLMDSR